ncbi:MAG: hypothetical protein ABR511_10295 [Acidimicrobiales bacterium]
MKRPALTDRRWNRGARVAAVAAGLGLAVVACGGSSGSSTKATKTASAPPTSYTGDPNKACSLAPKADVEAAVGAPVAPGVGSNGVVCRYEFANSTASSVVIATNQTSEASRLYDLELSSAAGAETLNGVADKAFVTANRAYVLRGSNLTIVTLTTTSPPPTATAALKKLAQAVASHS